MDAVRQTFGMAVDGEIDDLRSEIVETNAVVVGLLVVDDVNAEVGVVEDVIETRVQVEKTAVEIDRSNEGEEFQEELVGQRFQS